MGKITLMLPTLPKQKKQKEAKASITFRQWVEQNKINTASIEMKQTDGKDSLLFSEVSDQQITYALLINSDKGALIRVQGLNGEPDYVFMRNEPAYICIKYPKGFVMVHIKEWVKEKTLSERKSLTFERACEIGEQLEF